MDNRISNESKLNALMGIYNKDREEEREQWNRLHNLFTTFILLFLGATNVFIQLKEPTWITWLTFSVSIAIATGVYCYLHTGMQKRLLDAAKIKEGREILIKMLMNDTNVQEYKNNFFEATQKFAMEEFEARIKSPDYPFIAFHDIIHLKLRYREINKLYAVIVTGVVVLLLTLGYWLLK